MALRLEELAKTIDHALLEPAAAEPEIDRLCADAREHHLASVCVLPIHVRRAAAALRACDVKVCAVVGFPFGGDEFRAKIAAAERSVGAGANEIEVVLNIGAMLTGAFRLVRDEIVALNHAVRMQSVNTGKGAVLVKAVLETPRLDDKRKLLACKIVEDAGVDFAVTSTGYGGDGATLRDVDLLRDCLSESVGVKASGDIGTVADAYELVNAGAARLGTTTAVELLRDFPAVQSPR
jgi:deoxyribose-phosphate aldolase